MKKFIAAWSLIVILIGLFFPAVNNFIKPRNNNIAVHIGKLKELGKKYKEECSVVRTKKSEYDYKVCELLRRDIKTREVSLSQKRERYQDTNSGESRSSNFVVIGLVLFWLIPVCVVFVWGNFKKQ